MTRFSRSRTKVSRFVGDELLLQVSVMAVDRWDRLSDQEQARFRVLARQRGFSQVPLSRDEQRELKELLRKLEPRKLVREAVSLGAGGAAAQHRKQGSSAANETRRR